MLDLATLVARGATADFRDWLAHCSPAASEATLLGLREAMLELIDDNPALCRKMLNTVMPVLADPQQDLLGVFAAYLLVAARIEPDGDDLFRAAIDLSTSRNLHALSARGLAEWAHWLLTKGDAIAADGHFAEAQRTWTGLGRADESDRLWSDRAEATLRTGEWATAITQITRWLPGVASPNVRANLQLDLARCHTRVGNPVAADDALLMAEQLFEMNADTFGVRRAQVYRALWFWGLGAHDAAGTLLSQARDWFAAQGYPTEASVAAANLASLQIADGENLAQAKETLGTMVRSKAVVHDTLLRWQVTMNLAACLEKMSDYAEAGALYCELSQSAAVRDWEQKLAALNYLHLCLTVEPRVELQHALTMALHDPVVQNDPFLHFVAHENLGNWYRARNRLSEATECYAAALDCVEQSRLSLPWEFLRRRLQQSRLRVFDSLQAVLLDRSHWTEAWQVADRAKAQSLADFIGETQPPLSADGDRQFRRVRSRLARVYKKSVPGAGGIPKDYHETNRLECLLEETLGRSRRDYTDAHAHSRWEELPALHAEDVALLEFVRGSFGWGVYFVRGGQVRFQRLPILTSERNVNDQILAWWKNYRAMENEVSHQRWREETATWHRAFLGPLTSELEGVRQVLVVPHDAMCLLPWAGLWDAERSSYCVDRFPGGIAVLPGARVAQSPNHRDSGSAGQIDLVASPGTDLLFGKAEAEWIAAHFASGCRVLRGRQVTGGALRRLLPRCRWLHFAGHACFDSRRPMASFLQLSQGHRLTAWDLLVSRLPATAVVLAACEMGSAHTEAAGEWFGLLRGFLMAGASAVVAPLWETSDFASLPLMQAFYRRCRDAPGELAVALCESQISARALGDWAQRACHTRSALPAEISWEQALDAAESPFAGLANSQIVGEGLGLLGTGIKLWHATGLGKHAGRDQTLKKLWSLLDQLALLGHPRHWAAFQVYGSPCVPVTSTRSN